MLIPFHQTTFLKSVARLVQLPRDEGIEIAFAGRSNAGKSSALNAITGIKGLARTSKTPGRTQMINLFQITENYKLVDLPGYGYAEVPIPLKRQWGETLRDYLQTRACLKGLWIITDIRHPLQSLDQELLAWAMAASLPVHLLLSKADKLSRGASLQVLMQIQKQYQGNPLLTCQTFSAITGSGVPEARKQLSQWLLSTL